MGPARLDCRPHVGKTDRRGYDDIPAHSADAQAHWKLNPLYKLIGAFEVALSEDVRKIFVRSDLP